MSHDHFHVHGPDQHAVEHQAEHGDSLAIRVSIMTAILATFGAVFSYLGAAQQAAATDAKNDAILAKNQAIQSRTQAANQWSFYQAKSTKQNLSELGSELASNDILKEKYRREATRYQAEKEAIKQKSGVPRSRSRTLGCPRGPSLREECRVDAPPPCAGTGHHPHPDQHRPRLHLCPHQSPGPLLGLGGCGNARHPFSSLGLPPRGKPPPLPAGRKARKSRLRPGDAGDEVIPCFRH